MTNTAFESDAGMSPSYLDDVEPYRQQMLAHCYRMLGSFHEAEDAVQETFIRAWKGLDGFEGRASLKNWLYRIATNVCLNVLTRRKRQRRYMPDELEAPTEHRPDRFPDTDVPWLEPIPDTAIEDIADQAPSPEARYETAESVSLAFIAAVQHLPPRQRAALLLRDVLGWSAAETARLLDMTVTSVNSAVQRARGTLEKRTQLDWYRARLNDLGAQQDLLDRYLEAWESEDLDGLVSLLKENATLTMPPWRAWYLGRDAIRGFLAWAWTRNGAGRLEPVNANGQSAFVQYLDGDSQVPHAIWVPALGWDVESLIGFRDKRVARKFATPS